MGTTQSNERNALYTAGVARLTRLCLRFPAASLCALLLATAVFAAGLAQLRTDVGYRAFLGADHPSLVRFDAFLERFGGGLPMAAVWSCDESPGCDSVFDAAALEMARDVGEELRSSSAIRRVTSPADALLLVPSAFGPLPRRFVEAGEVVADRRALGERARLDPSWVGQLISANARVGAIVVEVEGSGSEDAVAAFAALEAALAPQLARGFEFHLVGGPVEFVVAGGELEHAMARVIPLMVLLVGVVTCLLMRSLRAAAASLVAVGGAVLWTLGALGFSGWAQNSLTQTLPPLVLVIGVCDAVHLVARYASLAAASPPVDRAARDQLLIAAADEVARPCLLTSLTTAAGFLSFAAADLASFAEFGVIAAFGVMAALLSSFSLLPLLMRQLPPAAEPSRRSAAAWGRVLTRMLSWPEARPLSVALLAVLTLAIACVGFARLRVDASFEELYGRDSQVVRWAAFVADHLRRPDTLEVELMLPASASLADPAALAVISSIADGLAEIEQLGPTHSLLGPLRWTHRLLHGDDPDEERVASTRAENEALLSMLSAFGAGIGEDGLAPFADVEAKRVRLSVESEKPPQDELREIMRRVDALLEGELPEGWRADTTGPLAVVHDMIEAIRDTQLQSFGFAGLAVFVLVGVFFRSLESAALALVPTVLPVVATLGALGLAGIPLDVGSAMVAAVILGVAVDDSVHLLERYQALLGSGHNPSDAIHSAVLAVGPALVTTSAALGVGFAALALSPWQSVASFGLVSSLAIAAALASTLLVLPALLLLIHGKEAS
jgi:predicted RND superfamily exporter protein